MKYRLLTDTEFLKKNTIITLCKCGKHYVNNGIGFKKKYVENNKKKFELVEKNAKKLDFMRKM